MINFTNSMPVKHFWKQTLFQLVPFFLFFGSFLPATGQIVINEYVPANVSQTVGGATNDWIEIYNAGSSSVNLLNYGLSDDLSDPYAFRFPSYILASHDYLLVLPTDKNNTLPVHHWETAVNASTTWKYFAGVSQPDTNWRNSSFNDAGWSSGGGGIGFGDGDDVTSISSTAKSVMMRKTFNVPDTAEILKAIFHIDYDDGFVAYLNGHEIARANIGTVGNRPLYNDFALTSHEAEMYQGGSPDSFYISPSYFKSILKQGQNVLAVEVHNYNGTSNDLTSRPFLTFGMASPGLTYSNPPSWFGTPPMEYFTAKFKLARNGETIYLSDQSGIIDQQTYSPMQADNSMGRKPDGSANWCLIGNPTPETSNNSSVCYTGYANQPVFTLPAGFYASSQWLALTNSTPGGVIRYTTNGDQPTTSSDIYTQPIHITDPMTVRARVFSSGYLPSDIVTNTYIIDDDIELPVFSITTDSLNLWDYNTGIYVLGPNAQASYPYFDANFWQDWQKPASIEYFDKTHSRILSFDADINIFGNYSRAKPQKSMEIRLKDSNGTGELNYSFLPDKPQIDKWENIILRNSGTDWNVVHFRDAFMQRVLKTTHTGYLGTEPAVMYLNGNYWGVFTIHENHDQHWVETNFHYKKDEIDYMKEGGSSLEVKYGTSDFFFNAYNFATTQNQTSPTFFSDMSNFWDLDNFKDYFIAETYYNNKDWIGDWTNNIKMWRPNKPDGKLRYLIYDLDMGCGYTGSYRDSTLYTATHPAAFSLSSNLLNAMLNNPQFKVEFVNRYADLINTIFKPSQMLPVVSQFEDSMSHDMPKHFAKWGSNMTSWQTNLSIMKSFINNRPAKVRDQIQWQFNFPKQVTLTFNVSPAGAGRIQVSTVIPESYPWTGVYFDGNPVTITAIPNPGYTFDHWNSNHVISNDPNQTTTYNFSHNTETITCYFTGSAQPANLVVSEFNYNSSSLIDAEDWIELHNYGSLPLDITGWSLKDQDDNDAFTFPLGTIIPANGYIVIAADLSDFGQSYPAVSNVIGPIGFDLSNSGDQIRLFDAYGQLFLSFYYSDLLPWPVQADGQGFTCELTSNTANPNNGSSWFSGCIGGSPGRAYTASLSTPTHVSGNTTFCSGQHTLLMVNNTPGYSYQWRRNGVDIPLATDTVYSASLGGNYTVRVSSQGCSVISDTLIVTSVTTGVPPVAPSVSRCGEGVVTLTASAPDSIYWFDTPNGSVIGTGTVFNTPTIASTTTYYVQSSLSCPSPQVAVTATIDPVPASPVCAGVSRCGPGTVGLFATSSATVNWYNDPVSGALIHSGNQFATGYIPHDTVFYAEADNSGCISERIAVQVTVTSATPPLVNTVSRCGPGTLVLTASSFSPVFWYDSLIGGNLVGSGVNLLTPSLTTSRYYFAEANNGCASARVPALAMVNEIPAPPVGADSMHCGPGTVDLFATSSYQVVWYSSPSGGTSLSTGGIFTTPTISTTTTYYAASYDLCSSSRVPINAVIEPIPPSPVGNDALICGSGSAQISATSSNPVYWFEQPSGGQVLGTGSTFVTPVINATTIYYAVAFDVCPSNPTPVTAFVTSIPSGFLGNDTTIQAGNTVTLNPGSGFDTYLWSNGATTQTITVNSSDNYWVIVSLNGCTQSDTIMVNVVVGIQDVNLFKGALNVFPNPVNYLLNIAVESKEVMDAEIVLSDITGKELIRKKLNLLPGANSGTLDVSGVSTGIYLLSLRSTSYSHVVSIFIN